MSLWILHPSIDVHMMGGELELGSKRYNDNRVEAIRKQNFLTLKKIYVLTQFVLFNGKHA